MPIANTTHVSTHAPLLPPSAISSVALELSESASSMADVVPVLGALDSLLAAAVFVELSVASRERGISFGARERLLAATSPLEPSLALVRSALGSKSVSDRATRRAQQISASSLHRARVLGAEHDEWILARDAAYGTWLRRTLINQDPWAYAVLFGWLELQELQRNSPWRARIGASVGLAGVATGGLVLGGPVGVAPAVFIGLVGAGVRLWKQVSEARVADANARVAEAQAADAPETSAADLQIRRAEARSAEARARSLEARARMDEATADIATSVMRAAGSELDRAQARDDVVRLATKTAAGSVRELAASPDITDFELDQRDRPAA